MKTLYNGRKVPTIINTEERIFKIGTFDNETVLCNLQTAHEIVRAGECKTLQHFWNCKFTRFGKNDLIEMSAMSKGEKI